MIPVTDPNHPSNQLPMPSLTTKVGGAQYRHTDVDIPGRQVRVLKTNPGIRALRGPAWREEKNNLPTRRVDVAVRSSNQNLQQMLDARSPATHLWGCAGLAAGEPTTDPAEVPFLDRKLVVGTTEIPYKYLAIAGGALAALLLLK